MRDLVRQTRRLALSYLAIIMTMSLLFSAILYGVTSAQLDRPLPPGGEFRQQSSISFDTQARIDARDEQTRQSLVVSLTALNIVVLASGAWLSYYLARRTLSPINESMRAQSRFISDASHELRTPLTALQTTNEVALRKKTLDDAKSRQVLEKNIAEIGKLRRLTETLLTLDQLDDRTLVLETVELKSLVSDVIDNMKDIAALKKISLTHSVESVSVSADPVALTQVLIILIDNAVKYSSDSTIVSISAEAVKSSVFLHVTDQGIGLSESEQAHVFDRFYRADSARTRTESSGHGLGLSIARSLVKNQGHTLTLKSSPREGTTFSVQLPVVNV